ncbi:MAG: Phosphate regulon transcriptional regulatory protein PhoB (SphR) [uncultured Solirubrobacteraceae bacterium]|uniref:Phosphate regulon transcriptional regulatory protein PhoB (SphR) n=1 Tax=uncultured Solirubrobacteraceae bacterium TaxID=1162706 RepID=A0A6J4RST0_9ACTN|nr:MAG: Phosphate regulon transcriptional regulatory protein PhoB (SphR) [uncultured Solirubrobacteraceae bacterium]
MAHILVVDDDRDVRGLVDFRLRKAAHQVLVAPDGAAALELVQDRGAPDLAILDVTMPGMSGLELLVELRRREGLEQLPAIFLSARILPADIAAGRALGATYLTKPFVAPALMAAVDAALGPADAWRSGSVRTPVPADERTPPAPAIPRVLTSRPPPGY